MRPLTEIEMTTGHDAEYDPTHAWVTLTGSVRDAWEKPEEFGHPTEAQQLAASIYISGVLARVACLLALQVDAERAMHGCYRGLYIQKRGDYSTPWRRITRGDKVGPDEFVTTNYDEHCYLSIEVDDLAKNERAPSLTITIPKNRRKAWTDIVRDRLALLIEEDRCLN